MSANIFHYCAITCSFLLLITNGSSAQADADAYRIAAVKAFCEGRKARLAQEKDVTELCSIVTPNTGTLAAEPNAGKVNAVSHLSPVKQSPGDHGMPEAASPALAAQDIPSGGVLIIRRDRSQAFEGLERSVNFEAPGGTITYTDNRLKDTQTTSLQGYMSYTWSQIFPSPHGGNENNPYLEKFAIVPWSAATGTLTLPVSSRAPSLSSFQSGLEAQFRFAQIDPLAYLAVGVTPYFQTDFAGKGQIVGFNAHFQPYQSQWHLNGRSDFYDAKAVAFLWTLFGETNFVHVEDAGYTNYRRGTDYAWLGGTAQLRLTFFQHMPDFPQGLFATVTQQYFSDALSSDIARKFDGEIGYKLSKGESGSGQASISFVYSQGTDVSTLQYLDQAKVQLNYRY